MNSLLIPAIYLLIGFSVYATIIHLSYGLRRPYEHTHLLFAGMCLLAVPFMFCLITIFQASGAGAYIQAMKWSYIFMLPFFVLFPWFIAEYSGKRPRALLLGLSATFGLLFIVNLFQPYSLQYEAFDGIRIQQLPWGETVTAGIGQTGPWSYFSTATVLVTFSYAFYALFSRYRQCRQPTNLWMLVGLGVFILTAVHGILGRLSIVEFVPLGPFGFLIMVAILSVTCTHETRRRLQDSEHRFRSLVEQSPFSIQMFTPDGRSDVVNPAWERLWGIPAEQVTDYNILSDAQLIDKGAMNHIVQAFAGEAAVIPPIVYNPADNPAMQGPERDRWVSAYIYPIKDTLGTVENVVIQHEDVTEKKRVEDTIRLIASGVSRGTGVRFFSQLVQSMAQLFEVDYAYIGVLDCSEGQRVNTLAFCAHGEIVANTSYPLVDTPCANVMSQRTCAYPCEVQQLFPSAQLLAEMDVQGYIGTPLFDVEGRALGLIVLMDSKPLEQIEPMREILEIFSIRASGELARARAEHDLYVKERAMEAAAEGIVLMDATKPDSPIVYANQAMQHITGYTREELQGNTLRLLHGEDTEPALVAKLNEAITEQRSCQLKLLNYRKNGDAFWNEITITPVQNEAGEVTHFIGTNLDISERLQTEEALRRSQKMQAVGQLAGGVAHDFNNQLGIVIGYLDFMRDYVASEDTPSRWVETATQATQRCMDLTRQLLAFSRGKPSETVVVDLNQELARMGMLIERVITPAISLRVVAEKSLWQVAIDPGEFQDAILNLVINARDAMPEGGELLIETSNRVMDEEFVSANSELAPGEYIQVMVSDTGGGMDKSISERVFEPFFTTKPEGKGTGLGLAMVYGFVQRYGGEIKVSSARGVGTVFRLFCPV